MAIAAVSLGLSACASTPQSCDTFAQPAASPKPTASSPIAFLMCAADSGSQPAQLALGKAYEVGDGVPVDYERAARLYNAAAAATPARVAIYSPPVKLGGTGRVQLYDNPNAATGIAEAKYRLGRMYLEGRGVRLNAKRGRELIEDAIQNGFVVRD